MASEPRLTGTRGVGAQHDQRRSEIADAVLSVVADRGLAAVSLTEVAATAGVSPGRVQHYFPTKQELIAAAFTRGNELSSQRIRRKVGADLSTVQPRVVLTTVLIELIPRDAATRAHLRVRQWFAALALADRTIATQLRTLYADLHRQLADRIHSDQADGDIDADVDPHGAAARLVALAEGLAYYVLIGVAKPAAARDQVLDAIDNLYARDVR